MQNIFLSRGLLLILIVATLGLRLYHLPDYPYHEDEAISLEVLTSITEEGLPLREGAIYWRSLAGHYLMAVPMFFMSPSPYSLRLIPLFFSLLMLPLIYLCGKSIESRWAGLLAAAFLAFSVYENLYASYSRFYLPFQFFFVCALYLSANYFIIGSRRSGFLLLFCAVLALGTHKLSLQLFPVFIIAFLLGRRWHLLRSLSFFWGGLLLALMAYLLHFWTPANTFSASTAIALIPGALPDKWAFYSQFKKHVPFGVSLLIVGLIPLWRSKKMILFYYYAAFLISLLGLSLIAPASSERYLCHLYPVGVVLAAASLSWWVGLLINFLRRKETLRYSHSMLIYGLILSAAGAYLYSSENTDVGRAVGREMKFTDQGPAHVVIARMMEPSDILISSEPGITKLYLGSSPDYFLRENLDQLRGKYSPFDDKSKGGGSKFYIDSPARLRALLKSTNERIFLYVNWKIMWSVSPEMRGLLNRSFSVVYSNNESPLNATYVMVRR